MGVDNQAISLIEQVDHHLKSVHTQSLDISFNELANMVAEGARLTRRSRARGSWRNRKALRAITCCFNSSLRS